METQGDRIRRLRERAGLTLEDLGKKVGLTKQAIYKYENNIVTNIPYDRIILLSNALQVKPWELLGWDVPQHKISKADGLTLTIPFISQKLSAGTGEDFLSDEDIDVKTIDIAAFMAKGIDKNTLLAAEVVGDSMIDANIFPGDIVVFSRGLVQAEGIYVVSFAGEVLVKRIEFDPLENKILIISENPKYKQRIIDADNENFRLLGKVVGWIHYEY